jgi:Icc-related predicted phosphoesterase
MQEVAGFNYFLSTLPHKHKVIIAGNHDLIFEYNKLFAESLITEATYLLDSSVEISGIKIYGSPWQPEFCNWAFNKPRGAPLRAVWAKIPEDTNILVTHGPPFGILDTISPGQEELGCKDLRSRVQCLKQLKLHCFGHIHGGYGKLLKDGVTYVNASTCNEAYKPVNKPIVVDI